MEHYVDGMHGIEFPIIKYPMPYCNCPTYEEVGMNPGTIIGLVTAFIILLLLFIFSVIAWELFRRDFD